MTHKLEVKNNKVLKSFSFALAINFIVVSIFSFGSAAATIQNSGDKAAIIIVAEGATRRDYSVDPQKQISFCLKGCFITLANGDRYALNGSEVIEISGNRISFH